MATVDFMIKRFNGHTIQRLGGADCVVYWAVFVKDNCADAWIFLKSFYRKDRAQQFIAEVKDQINHGDFSCLSLRG